MYAGITSREGTHPQIVVHREKRKHLSTLGHVANPEPRHLVGVADSFHKDGESVGADAAGGSVGTEGVLNEAGDLLEKNVAALVAQALVEPAETV